MSDIPFNKKVSAIIDLGYGIATTASSAITNKEVTLYRYELDDIENYAREILKLTKEMRGHKLSDKKGRVR